MKEIEKKLREILRHTGWTQGRLAECLGTTQATISRWFSGADPRGEMRDAINKLYTDLLKHDTIIQTWTVPLMGYIGAGAEILSDFEQIPENGIEQIEVPFPLPADMIAFEVRGDSMLPAYKEGYIIIVHKEQTRPLEAFYGDEVAVKIKDGRRFIKTIMRGLEGVNLISWNSTPIENVEVLWIGEIFAILPKKSLRFFKKTDEE